MRKTKIIVTLGPSTESEEMLEKLIAAGTNIFRLNMSHSTHDWVRDIVKKIRALATKMDRQIGILMDTQGPAIRTGDLPTKLDLKVGDTFSFTIHGFHSEETRSVDTNYDDLINDVNVGDVVLIDNGMIQMEVKEKDQNQLKCEVLTPGTIGSRRHINLPGVRVKLPALTEKDLADIAVGAECNVDFIALSFVREARDISLLRELLKSKNSEYIQIVAKIEDVFAVRNIDEIIAVSDAIMVARGDLGIECPYEELPIIQRKVAKKCLIANKPVIVATHLLESMVQNPMPTRAEITDVSNAVYEAVDALMLSGETTVGRYPVQCVEVLDRMARRVEQSGNMGLNKEMVMKTDKQTMTSSAVILADKIKAKGICVFTRSGKIAEICAGQRPRWSPIFAFTPDEKLVNQLSLNYGIYAFKLIFGDNPEDNITAVWDLLKQKGYAETGAKFVVISDVLTHDHPVNSIQLRLCP